MKRLKEGRVVGIFPEGGIRDGAASIVNGAEMKQGVTLLSLLADAPVIPCVILGSDRLYNPPELAAMASSADLDWLRQANSADTGDADEEWKDSMGRLLSSEIVKLKERLCEDFRLTEADLPHPPRHRMRER